MEKHCASKIVMIQEVVEEAARVGRPAGEILAERLASEQKRAQLRAQHAPGGAA
jgi:hypothetical protein